MSKKKPAFAVVIEGGVVQHITSNLKSLIGRECLIIDYDVNDSADNVVNIEQGDGTSNEAWVTPSAIIECSVDLNEIKNLLE